MSARLVKSKKQSVNALETRQAREVIFLIGDMPPSRYGEILDSCRTRDIPRNPKLAKARETLQVFICTFGLDACFKLFTHMEELHDGRKAG